MITASEFITAVSTAIADDQILKDWCMDQFEAEPVVYEGDPDEAVTPSIAILGVVGFGRAHGKREAGHQLIIGYAVENDERVESGNRRIYTGLHQVETMRELAENAVFRAGITGGVAVEHAQDPDIRYPMFVSYSIIGITQLKSTRRPLPDN
ncbi:MAG: hypothetical protein SWH61_03305 [Thermodesulfobacteriota bacterium]|nr:hypothetical protein [Thermodesulfobacteriota bacterium]